MDIRIVQPINRGCSKWCSHREGRRGDDNHGDSGSHKYMVTRIFQDDHPSIRGNSHARKFCSHRGCGWGCASCFETSDIQFVGHMDLFFVQQGCCNRQWFITCDRGSWNGNHFCYTKSGRNLFAIQHSAGTNHGKGEGNTLAFSFSQTNAHTDADGKTDTHAHADTHADTR